MAVDDGGAALHVAQVRPREPGVAALLDALTLELAHGGYGPSETFGYSVEQLESGRVHLVGACVDGRLVGLGGVELHDDDTGELKLLRLETGDKQHAAIAFYRRHGFVESARFGPYLDSATSVCMEVQITDAASGGDHRPGELA